MKDQIGKCLFCGQLMTIRVEENLDQDEIDARVTSACTCPDGLKWRQEQEAKRRKKEAMENACKNIEELFEGDNPCAAQLLYNAVSLAADKKIRGVSISLGNDTTAKLTASGGKIKVERVEKRNTSRTTDFE